MTKLVDSLLHDEIHTFLCDCFQNAKENDVTLFYVFGERTRKIDGIKYKFEMYHGMLIVTLPSGKIEIMYVYPKTLEDDTNTLISKILKSLGESLCLESLTMIG